MHRLLIGIFLNLSLFACAHADTKKQETWQVERLGYEVWASRPDIKDLRILLQPSGGGDPKIVSWEPVAQASGIFVLKYIAGEIGTSERILEIRAAVVRLTEREVLVDEVFAYKDALHPSRDAGPQPQWSWTSKSLLIERPDREKPIKVAL